MIRVVATRIPAMCGAHRASRDQSGQDGWLPEVGRQVQGAGRESISGARGGGLGMAQAWCSVSSGKAGTLSLRVNP